MADKQIKQFTEDLTPAGGDLLLVQKAANDEYRKVTRSTFFSGADWSPITQTPTTITYNGQRSYTILYPGVDLTNVIQPGTRLRTTRTVAAPTQCASLNGTNQYFNDTSVAGMTFTDDFTAGAWVKLSNYGSVVYVISRYSGTSGWGLRISSEGVPSLRGLNGGSTNFTEVAAYQSIPLNKWVHIVGQLDMNTASTSPTTNYIMIDGVSVPVQRLQGGTNPTALVQAGNLEVGSFNNTNHFPGKIAQAFVSSAKITQDNVRTLISQGLTSALVTSNNIISAYSLSNSLTDINTTNANNLTAQNSATTTNADSPFGTQGNGTISSTLDYGIIQSATFSTDTTVVVQAPEGCTIPTSGGVSASAYSGVKAPYGFPASKDKWSLASSLRSGSIGTTSASYGSFISGGWALTVPVGAWTVGWRAPILYSSTTSATFNISRTALTGLTIVQGHNISPYSQRVISSAAANYLFSAFITNNETLASQSTFVMYSIGAASSATLTGDAAPTDIFAENAYL